VILYFPDGLKIDLAAFLVRCGLCRRFFKAGEEATFGVDLTVWAHRRCWEDITLRKESHEALFTIHGQ